jgi:hypothetical protein
MNTSVWPILHWKFMRIGGAAALIFAVVFISPLLAQPQFVQQAKLVGTGVVGFGAFQGTSVALSADGNTAIMGGPEDNDFIGAVWVFTRRNGVWTGRATSW